MDFQDKHGATDGAIDGPSMYPACCSMYRRAEENDSSGPEAGALPQAALGRALSLPRRDILHIHAASKGL